MKKYHLLPEQLYFAQRSSNHLLIIRRYYFSFKLVTFLILEHQKNGSIRQEQRERRIPQTKVCQLIETKQNDQTFIRKQSSLHMNWVSLKIFSFISEK